MMNQARKEIGGLDDMIAKGSFGDLREWLRSKVHKIGRRRTASELIVDITGQKLSAKPFLDYLEAKYKAVYSL